MEGHIYDLVLFADDPNLFFSHIYFTTLMNLINSEMLKLSVVIGLKPTSDLYIYKSQVTY